MTNNSPVLVDEQIISSTGTVYAVHLSYVSRAKQRGRFPKLPSYFLKAKSSLARSETPVERPAGTQLLTFEGEIVLIIGKTCHQVEPDAAWEYVQWVTAGNDLGVQDLKYIDKGSNIRSKSGAGYSPLGPGLLPAQEINPDLLHVRTWVDSELVQEAYGHEMLFRLPHLVADLSQQITLQPGDIIFTGTPAGSSVFHPGQTVEVEVDYPPLDISTGRLVTSAIQGERPLPAWTVEPQLSEPTIVDAWGDKDAAKSALAQWRAQQSSNGRQMSDAELFAKLEKISTATLNTMLRKRGITNSTIEGLKPTQTGQIVGRARTLRYVPLREDLFKKFGGGFNAQKRVIDDLNPGEILVMEARGETTSGTLGDILAMRAKVRGAVGIITDGGVRDLGAVTEVGLPVFHSGGHPAVLGRRHVPWDTDITVSCGGATVQVGDVIVADADGIIVIPADLAEEVAIEGAATEAREAFILDEVAKGAPIKEIFPMNEEWKARYADFQAQTAQTTNSIAQAENKK